MITISKASRIAVPVLVMITLAVPATAVWASPTRTAVRHDGATGVAPCTAKQLTVHAVRHPGGGAAGHYAKLIMFTNISLRPCTIIGYPAVSMAARRGGAPVNQPATQGGDPPTLVQVTPADAAHATLMLTNPDNYGPEQCRPVTVAGLLVRTPGTSATVYVPSPDRVCSATGMGVPWVTAVQPRPYGP